MYNYEYLLTFINDEIKLLEDYSKIKLNSKTKIEYVCKCNKKRGLIQAPYVK